MDVKFIEPLKGARKPRYYQFTAIDDCTRLRVLRSYDKNNQTTAIRFLDYVCQKLPFRIDTIQTDNGSEFASKFHWHVLDRGIRHVDIKPATPRLNGKVEGSHRIDAEEFYRLLDGQVIDDAKVFNERLAEWETYYNHHRPHENRPPGPTSALTWCPVRPVVRLARPARLDRIPVYHRRQRKRLLAQWVHGYDDAMDRITVNPRQMGGVPCIRGLRIPVATVVGMIADGMTPDEIVAELPPLELDDISAALRFAADAVADREIPLQPTA
jgi:uncharacterized protein (DUF433 family)